MKRTAKLYSYEDTIVPVFVASCEYEHTTLAYECQVAHDLACEWDIRSGHVAIIENGECINKLGVY